MNVNNVVLIQKTKRGSTTRVGKIRAQVALPRKGGPCKFSRHAGNYDGRYGSCLRQVVRRIEYLASLNPSKNFCYPTMKDLVKHSGTGKHGYPRSNRQVRACVYFLLAIGWLRRGVGCDQYGVPRRGYFIKRHDAISHSIGALCVLNADFIVANDVLAAAIEAPLIPENSTCDSTTDSTSDSTLDSTSDSTCDSTLDSGSIPPVIPRNSHFDSGSDSAFDSTEDDAKPNEASPLQKHAENPAPDSAPDPAAPSHVNQVSHVTQENQLNHLSHLSHPSHRSQENPTDAVDAVDADAKPFWGDVTENPPGLTKTKPSLQAHDGTKAQPESEAQPKLKSEPNSGKTNPNPNPNPESTVPEEEDEDYETIGEHFAELMDFGTTLEEVVTAISDGVAHPGILAKYDDPYRDALLGCCRGAIEENSEEPSYGDDDTERRKMCAQIMLRAMRMFRKNYNENTPRFWTPVMRTLEGKPPRGRSVAA